MEQRDAILFLLGLVIGLVAWGLRELWDSHKKLQDQMNIYALKMPMEFVTKSELQEVKSASSQMEVRLNQRIDRSETTLLERMDKLGESISKGLDAIWIRLDKKADRQ